MKDLVELLARSLVDHPEVVEVQETKSEQSLSYDIVVSREDVGKVIGKQGRIINALRTVAKAAATKSGQKVHVDVVS